MRVALIINTLKALKNYVPNFLPFEHHRMKQERAFIKALNLPAEETVQLSGKKTFKVSKVRATFVCLKSLPSDAPSFYRWLANSDFLKTNGH